MNEKTARAVRRRAGGRCEYCLLPADAVALLFEIEHIIPKQHGGSGALTNCAFSCLHCNRRKGPNLSGINRSRTGRRIVPLFNPRRQRWSRHFAFRGSTIVGITAVGRATVYVLGMNDPLMVELRSELIKEGRFRTG